MTKITETWCPQCEEGTRHEDRFIDAKNFFAKKSDKSKGFG